MVLVTPPPPRPSNGKQHVLHPRYFPHNIMAVLLKRFSYELSYVFDNFVFGLRIISLLWFSYLQLCRRSRHDPRNVAIENHGNAIFGHRKGNICLWC